MDCKIPFIYIAETQQSRKINMSKYSYLLSHENQDSSVRAVKLEYLRRYMHQILVLYFIVNYFIFHVLLYNLHLHYKSYKYLSLALALAMPII
jgi:hypothetical protein